MIEFIRTQRSKVAKLLGGIVIGYAAAAWNRIVAANFGFWAID